MMPMDSTLHKYLIDIHIGPEELLKEIILFYSILSEMSKYFRISPDMQYIQVHFAFPKINVFNNYKSLKPPNFPPVFFKLILHCRYVNSNEFRNHFSYFSNCPGTLFSQTFSEPVCVDFGYPLFSSRVRNILAIPSVYIAL